MKYKIQILKSIDAIIGKPAIYISRLIRPRASSVVDISGLTAIEQLKKYRALKILVIRPGGIGDAVLLFPALKKLKDEFKDCRVDLLAEKRNYGIFKHCEYTENIILYDRKPFQSLLKLYRAGYDIVIDTEQWHRLTSVIGYLTRAPVRVGFNTNERVKLFTHSVEYSHEDYESVSFLNLVSSLTLKKYEFDPNREFLSLKMDDSSEIAEQMEEYSKKWEYTVGIFSGATVDERLWGVKNFVEVAKKLNDNNIGIVVLGGDSEIGDSREFEKVLDDGDFLSFVGRTTLHETAVVISKLDLFISSDTGLMHIAYGVGTPTVSLFGAGIEPKWGPKGAKNIIINKNLPCSPC
ncbi:MAG: glycosyltransferase family 9 protein, partial [Candidatus Dadabacteria bacterium]|nr:glycosyltransferase family 9 protein [Candidatus Dadabacteria bacterium]NIT13715.1 glycosyltransferase family 9 protein [Candidatus Dadabacteria bacterium]